MVGTGPRLARPLQPFHGRRRQPLRGDPVCHEMRSKRQGEAYVDECDRERFLALREAIETSKAFEVNRRQTSLQITYYVFSRNVADLEAHLLALKDPRVQDLWDVTRRDALMEYLRDVTRHLHNSLAAAKTLVDHTRVMVDDLYANTHFADEYSRKVKDTFDASDLSHFFQDLRNFALHKQLPAAQAHMQYTSGLAADGQRRGTPSLDFTIRLDVAELKKWQGFTKPARAYIETLPDQVDLSSIVSQYKALVEGFYQWFGQRQAAIHAKDVEAIQPLQDELRMLFQRNGLPVPPDEEAPGPS